MFRQRPELIDAVYPDARPASTSSGGVSLAQVLQLERGVLGQVEFLPVVEEASDSDMVVGRILRHAVNQVGHISLKNVHLYSNEENWQP